LSPPTFGSDDARPDEGEVHLHRDLARLVGVDVSDMYQFDEPGGVQQS
jgi:hypothetical protein